MKNHRLAPLVLIGALMMFPSCGTTNKQSVTRDYIRVYVENQSANKDLAQRLSKDFDRGWQQAIELLGQGLTSSAVAEKLRALGHSVFLLENGVNEITLPGEAFSLLILNREKGWQEITDDGRA